MCLSYNWKCWKHKIKVKLVVYICIYIKRVPTYAAIFMSIELLNYRTYIVTQDDIKSNT